MIQPTDTSEKAFQKLITQKLVNENGFVESYSNDFDREFCLNRQQLFEFLENTQLEAFSYIQQRGERAFLVRLDKRIEEKGIVETLRNGVKFFDRTIRLFYPEPNSVYNAKDLVNYEANIFSVTEELVYTDNNKNRLDTTLFVNGLPVLTMELKNAYTYQAVENAIKQYKYDRSAKDKIFHLGRCMAHFAADTNQVYMTGGLNGESTAFFPFNKGLNNGEPHGPFGAGNPVNPNGIKTAYLWEEVFTKSSLSNIINKFATLITETNSETGKSKKIQIFPRYHQLNVVRKLLKDTKQKGVGMRYLIQHSAGSGKSNSITWLAHQLISVFGDDNETPLFDSVLVVTDRMVLDKQIRENIKAFAQVKRVVEGITGNAKDIKELDPSEESYSKTTHMRLALANNKKIITCTVQTFPFVLKAVQDMATKKVAIIIDEAHSSQSGEAAASMNALFADIDEADLPKDEEGRIATEDLLNYLVESRKMLPNASYYAFTATPKNKTLETFGTPNPYQDEYAEAHNQFLPFHSYSMKQAIEEEFILDVLENYTTLRSYYKIKSSAEGAEEKEFETSEANKRIRSYVEGNEIAINDKARIMIDHFNQHVRMRIQNKAKAMVVCKSIESAMKYKEAFDTYLKEINSNFKAIVAFSGKKKHWKTDEELTEEKMNAFKDGNNDIPKQFEHDTYRFLIVADKYQTGFDQPLLHTMYVDKKLSDVQAVQTLSRLNRAKKPHKRETFVLDFFNDTEDIKRAFEPYYTTTILSKETDVNKLNDLQEEMDNAQVYDGDEVTRFFESYYNPDETREVLDAIISKIVRDFNENLIKDQQIAFKSNAKTFVRTYSYLSRIMDFKNLYWEELWLFLKHLVPMLKIEDEEIEDNILEMIDMDSYRTSRIEENKHILLEEAGEIDPIPVSSGGGVKAKQYDSLENIIKIFNANFGDMPWDQYGVDAKDAETALSVTLPTKIKDNSLGLMAILNSDKTNAKEESNAIVRAAMQSLMFTNTGIFKLFSDDEAFRNRYQEFIFDMIWAQGKSDRVGK